MNPSGCAGVQKEVSMNSGSGATTCLALILIPMFLLTAWQSEKNRPSDAASDEEPSPGLRWSRIAILAGVILRLWQYLLNRSLWSDEALLGLNIVHRTYSGLLKPLDRNQRAPIGFLLLEKFLLQHLGSSEYVLRLAPLLAGILSLFLFYIVARRVASPGAVAIAMGLFAIAPPLIYYSSELKQYSSDVTVALLLYVIAFSGSPAKWSELRIAALGLIGAIAIWFSHPAVFVLAGIGMVFVWVLVAERQWGQLARFVISYAFVIGSLVADYLVSLRALSHDEYLLSYWDRYFMPILPKTAFELRWYYDSFFEFLRSPVGFAFSGLAALALIAGGFSLYTRARLKFWLLLSPALFALLASALHKYPFGGRLTLFLVPATLLFMAEGVELVQRATRRDPLVGYAFIGLLLVNPAVYLLQHFTRPHVLVATPGIALPEEIKPVMAHVRSHQGPSDVIYMFLDSQPAYEFYRERDHLNDPNVLMGTAEVDDSKEYLADLNRLRGRRAWLVFSHVNGTEADAPKDACFYLDAIGQRVETFSSAGAVAYLYDLTGK